MYKVERINTNMISVTETLMSPLDSNVRTVLIDTSIWYKSSPFDPSKVGVDDVNLSIKMVPADIAWTQKHYLSKL